MIYLKLRQAGQCVNHKRVERLYGLERLQIKRRRRKKIPEGVTSRKAQTVLNLSQGAQAHL